MRHRVKTMDDFLNLSLSEFDALHFCLKAQNTFSINVTNLSMIIFSVGEESCSDLQAGIAARTLANIADVLGCMAGPKGGLRSGPAANTVWSKAFKLLEVAK